MREREHEDEVEEELERRDLVLVGVVEYARVVGHAPTLRAAGRAFRRPFDILLNQWRLDYRGRRKHQER